jgi:hypothetical protein
LRINKFDIVQALNLEVLLFKYELWGIFDSFPGLCVALWTDEPAMCFGKTLMWVKLSNSGDTLKLLIPSYRRKAISGWSHSPCKVISQKMSENEMGYRGSKSEFLNPQPT